MFLSYCFWTRLLEIADTQTSSIPPTNVYSFCAVNKFHTVTAFILRISYLKQHSTIIHSTINKVKAHNLTTKSHELEIWATISKGKYDLSK